MDPAIDGFRRQVDRLGDEQALHFELPRTDAPPELLEQTAVPTV